VRIIKKLDQFVLKNFIMLFCGTFVICLFVVMMQFLWKFIDVLVGKGLSIDVLAKFFFYAAETLVAMALPLAILLAALISFGNMGERLELLAIKAAGISLWRTMRPLIFLMLVFTGVSYYFQDVVAPRAQNKVFIMNFSLRQKSPELDIPEGVFYDGVEGLNLFVQRKDKESGMLYGCIIYNMRDGVNNAHILLADSGRLETSADKQHLLLHLYNGEQFENMNNNALKTNNVPYRRETFVTKHFVIDFDQNFEMSDADFSNSARTKNIGRLVTGIDSLEQVIDSTSRAFYKDMKRGTLHMSAKAWELTGAAPEAQGSEAPKTQTKQIGNAAETPEPAVQKTAQAGPHVPLDSAFAHTSQQQQMNILQRALQRTTQASNDLDFKKEVMKQYQKDLRMHEIQIWQKITLALACLIFFFIGAPLGAIIRKGGLGMPVVVAVVIFLFYYIVNSFGYNLSYAGTIPPLVGMWFSTAVLAPIGAFLTIKANNDSVVFNIDSYRNFFRRLWGIPQKRHIARKEVIIYDPDYPTLAAELDAIGESARQYRRTQHLTRLPNYLDVFFRNERDEQIEQLSERMEVVIDALGNSKDGQLLRQLNAFPVLDPHAHTAPFRSRRWNKAAGIVFPVGLLLLLRMARFRRRLRKDLQTIVNTSATVAQRCREIASEQSANAAAETAIQPQNEQ